LLAPTFICHLSVAASKIRAMADDFDPLMNPEPESEGASDKPTTANVPASAPAKVSLNAPAPTFAPPRPPQQNKFSYIEDNDDSDLVNSPAPAPSPAKPKEAPKGLGIFSDNDEEDPLSSAAAAVAAPRLQATGSKAVAPAVKAVDAASSNASQFTGVTKRGSTLFNDVDGDLVLGGASDIFIPSEARGLETGIDLSISVEAIDDDLLQVNNHDIDNLFVEQLSSAAPSRKDRLGPSITQPGLTGNRNPAVSSFFGPIAKITASSTAAVANNDDGDDLFGDIGAKVGSDAAINSMSDLNLQDYIAKQKSRCYVYYIYIRTGLFPYTVYAATHPGAYLTDLIASLARRVIFRSPALQQRVLHSASQATPVYSLVAHARTSELKAACAKPRYALLLKFHRSCCCLLEWEVRFIKVRMPLHP
jgi:hypothetical protein